MCKSDKQYILELRSEDAVSNNPTDPRKYTDVFFKELNLKSLLNDHPEGDSPNSLWNVEIIDFILYNAKGLDNAESIDVIVDGLSSPFVLSSKKTGDLTLGTVKATHLADIDNSDSSQILPVAHFIKYGEHCPRTCRVRYNNWNVKLLTSRGQSLLVSSTDSGDDAESNIISHFILRLKFTPYLQKE